MSNYYISDLHFGHKTVWLTIIVNLKILKPMISLLWINGTKQ